jgi:hypothetical protein
MRRKGRFSSKLHFGFKNAKFETILHLSHNQRLIISSFFRPLDDVFMWRHFDQQKALLELNLTHFNENKCKVFF